MAPNRRRLVVAPGAPRYPPTPSGWHALRAGVWHRRRRVGVVAVSCRYAVEPVVPVPNCPSQGSTCSSLQCSCKSQSLERLRVSDAGGSRRSYGTGREERRKDSTHSDQNSQQNTHIHGCWSRSRNTRGERQDYRERGESRATVQHDILIRRLEKVAGDAKGESRDWKIKLIIFVGGKSGSTCTSKPLMTIKKNFKSLSRREMRSGKVWFIHNLWEAKVDRARQNLQ
jgi:hypothetical protein